MGEKRWDIVWSGSTWRTFPPPTVGTLPDPAPPPTVLDGTPRRYRDRIWRHLTEDRQSIAALAHRSGVKYRETWRALKLLVREGRAVEDRRDAVADPQRRRRRGAVVVWYRKAE